MKSESKHIFLKTSIWILFSALLFLFMSTNAFLHYHIAADGSIRVHSHPIHSSANSGDSGKSPVQHSHTNAEFYFYKIFCSYDKFVLTENPHPFAAFKERIITWQSYTEIRTTFFENSFSLRAPPVL